MLYDDDTCIVSREMRTRSRSHLSVGCEYCSNIKTFEGSMGWSASKAPEAASPASIGSLITPRVFVILLCAQQYSVDPYSAESVDHTYL